MMFGDKARKALIRLILKTIPASITGTVKSVDESDHTCVISPSSGGSDYEGVRLNAVVNDSSLGLVCIPQLNSEVVISPLFNNEHAYFVSRFSTVDKWHLNTVSNGVIDLDANGNIILNATTFGGVPKAGAVATKLNVLEAQENAIKVIVSAILAAGTSAPTVPVTNATLAALFLGFNVSPITPTVQANLENVKVKHG